MKNIFHPYTLQLKKIGSTSFAKGLVIFFAILFGFIGLVEVFGRSPLGLLIPPPSLGVDNFLFDAKVYYLENFYRKHDMLDCLIIGSSPALDDLDPTTIEKKYKEYTGNPVYCYNFGLPALRLESGGMLAEALVNRFHPRLLVYVITARDFNVKSGALTDPFVNSAWVRYNLGIFTWKGWFANYFYTYRYFMLGKYAQIRDNRDQIVSEHHSITHQGFWPLYGLRKDAPGFKQELPDFEFEPKCWDGFVQVGNLRDNQTTVTFIEAPVSPDFLPSYLVDGIGVYEQNFIIPIQTYLSDRQISFWRTASFSLTVPGNGWWDPIHLNVEGSLLFSDWFTERLASQFPPAFFKNNH